MPRSAGWFLTASGVSPIGIHQMRSPVFMSYAESRDRDDILYASDGLSGHLRTGPPRPIEFLGVDLEGNIYAGAINRVRLARYVPFRPPAIGGRQR